MKKRTFGVFVIVFLLLNPLVLADHGFWNEVQDAFKGNIAGQAAVDALSLSSLPDGEKFIVQAAGEEYTYRRVGNTLERKTGWFSWDVVDLGRVPTLEDVKNDVRIQIGEPTIPLETKYAIGPGGVALSQGIVFDYVQVYEPPQTVAIEEPAAVPFDIRYTDEEVIVSAGKEEVARYGQGETGSV